MRASIFASTASVLVSSPSPLARSLACLGLTTTTAKPLAASAATSSFLSFPVASRTIYWGSIFLKRLMSCLIPSAEFGTVSSSLLGRMCSTSSSFATSIPTNVFSFFSMVVEWFVKFWFIMISFLVYPGFLPWRLFGLGMNDGVRIQLQNGFVP